MSPSNSSPMAPRQNQGNFSPGQQNQSNVSPTSVAFHPHSWFGKTFGLPKPEPGYSSDGVNWESTQVRQQNGRASWDTLDRTFKYDWSIAREKYDIARSSRAGESAFSPPQHLDSGIRRGARLPIRTAQSTSGGHGGEGWDHVGSPSSLVAQEPREWSGDGGYATAPGGFGGGFGGVPGGHGGSFSGGGSHRSSFERQDGGGFN